MKGFEKKSFLKNLELLFRTREKDKTPTREPATEPEVASEPTKAKTKHKISSLKICEEFVN